MPRLTKQQQTDILLADFARWQEREAASNAPTETSRASIADYHGETPLLRGIGMIPASDTRRKTPRREPRVTTRGVAAFSTDPEHIARLAAGDVNPTVRVIRADGSDTIVPASHFHAERSHKTTRTVQAAKIADTARFDTHHDFTS
jgi:hypothetical protein